MYVYLTTISRRVTTVDAAGLQTLRQGSAGRSLPSARLVSSMIAEDRDMPHHMQSLWLMVWGQFTDHDLSHTALSKDVIHPSGITTVHIKQKYEFLDQYHCHCALIVSITPKYFQLMTK